MTKTGEQVWCNTPSKILSIYSFHRDWNMLAMDPTYSVDTFNKMLSYRKDTALQGAL